VCARDAGLAVVVLLVEAQAQAQAFHTIPYHTIPIPIPYTIPIPTPRSVAVWHHEMYIVVQLKLKSFTICGRDNGCEESACAPAQLNFYKLIKRDR